MQARLTKKRQRRVVYHCQPRGARRLQNISSARARARKHERRAAAGIFFHSSLFYRHKYLPAQLTRASPLNDVSDKPGSKVECVRPLPPSRYSPSCSYFYGEGFCIILLTARRFASNFATSRSRVFSGIGMSKKAT